MCCSNWSEGLRMGRADLTRADSFTYGVTWPFRRDCQLLIWGSALRRHHWRCCLQLILSAWHALEWHWQASGCGCRGLLGCLIGKIQSCGQHHSLGWGSGLSEKENSGRVPALTSLCVMTAAVTTPATVASPPLQSVPSNCEPKQILPSLSYLTRFFVIAVR